MIIYLIENKINHKIYIGQTITPLHKRVCAHKRDAKSYSKGKVTYNQYLYASMNKYGWDNFTFETLDSSAKSQKELDALERAWIGILKSTDKDIGYNLELGGRGRGKTSEETKRKISESQKGDKNANFGKKMSLQQRKDISATLKTKGLWSGTKNPNAKLTQEIANDIRKEYKNTNITYAMLAKKYGITKTNVGKIINNKLWRQS